MLNDVARDDVGCLRVNDVVRYCRMCFSIQKEHNKNYEKCTQNQLLKKWMKKCVRIGLVRGMNTMSPSTWKGIAARIADVDRVARASLRIYLKYKSVLSWLWDLDIALAFNQHYQVCIQREIATHCFCHKIQVQSNKVCYKVSICENFRLRCCRRIIPLSNGI